MIDFTNPSVFKLSSASPSDVESDIRPVLLDGENVVTAYKGPRDFVVFTDKRIVAVNIQGITGKKRDYSSLPYARIQAFSVETAGRFDRDAELELYFSGLGKVRLEFKGNVDIAAISRLVAAKVL